MELVAAGHLGDVQLVTAAALGHVLLVETSELGGVPLVETLQLPGVQRSRLQRRREQPFDLRLQRCDVRAALESRDTIGQAKGIIMVTVGCSADEAFKLLRDQSQHENRKLVEIAAEIAGRATRTT